MQRDTSIQEDNGNLVPSNLFISYHTCSQGCEMQNRTEWASILVRKAGTSIGSVLCRQACDSPKRLQDCTCLVAPLNGCE